MLHYLHARPSPALFDAQVTGLRQCDICVVCKGCTPPDRAKCPVAVSESWLLDLAATCQEPALSDAYDARKLMPA